MQMTDDRMTQFTEIKDEDYICSAWFERDEQFLGLETPNGRVVFELRGEELSEEIEAGYMPTPRVPRPRDKDWQPCAVEYARSRDLIK